MKIVHCHHSLTSGGIEAIITGLANEMSKDNDVDVCLITIPKDEDIFFRKLSKKIRVYNLGKKNPGFSFSIPFKVVCFFLKHKYDAIQLHGCFYYYMLAIWLLHRKMKFFYTVHNDAFLENSKWDKRIFALKKAFIRWGWICPITISNGSQASFEKLYPHSKNIKIFNGIPTPVVNENFKSEIDRYRISSATKVFFNPGRICEQKNQLTLVKVFTRLINEGYDISLIIAGQIQNRDILESLRPYFSDRISYIGEIDNIPSMLSFCDGMVLPSLFEGLPVVLLESLAVGCPPICSPVGGVPDIVNSGENGLLSEDSSEDSFYNNTSLIFE